MAAPAATQAIATEIGNLIKIHYGPQLINVLNEKTYLWSLLEDGTDMFQGSHWEVPVRTNLPQSVGPRASRGTLPLPGASNEATSQIRARAHYGSFDITGPDIARARSNKDAFVVSLTDRMKSIMDSYKKDMNCQSFLSGTGIYATVTSLPGTTTDVVVDQVKYLMKNRYIDIWDDSASAVLEAAATNARIVSDINPATLTISMNVARPGGIAVGDSLIPETGVAAAGTAVGMFLNGLAAIVDDGTNVTTFQNISRTTERMWRAHVFGNSGTARPLTLGLLQTLFDVPRASSGKDITMLLAAPNGRKKYLDLLVNQKRFMTQKMDGGYSVLEYNGKEFYIDDECQDGTIYGLCRDDIRRYAIRTPEFDDTDGNVLKWTSRKDVFEGFIAGYMNLGAKQCNSHGKITDLETDAAYRVARS